MAIENSECGTPTKPVATVDQIAWVYQAVSSAIKMALVIEKEVNTGIQQEISREAMEGLSKGATREILRVLHYDIGATK